MIADALLAAVLIAQATGLPQPPPRMDVDASPTSFACTFTSALRGETCTYEAEPHSVADAKANVKLAADQAARICAAEAEPGAQRKACVDLTEKAARERCTGDGEGLADEQGRLTKAAEPCALALRQAIRRATGRVIESTAPDAGPSPSKPAPAKPIRKPHTSEKI